MCRGGVLSVVALVCLVAATGACSSSSGDDGPNSSTAGSTHGGASGAGAPAAGSGGSPAAGSSSGGSAPTAGAAHAGAMTSGGAGGAAGGGAPSGGASSGGSAGASGAPAGGGGGGGGSPALELELPIARSGGEYTLEFGDLVFTVDPAAGARVTTFSLKGKNLLTDSAADMSGPEKNNWGSTFWPSPQTSEAWGGESWPPIPEIDGMPYTPTLDGTTIVMKSAVSVRGKMSVTKRFAPVLDAGAVDLTYELKNEGTAPMSWAPWQITRVALNGLTFFPTGTNVVDLTSNALPTARVMKMGAVSWYENQSGDEGKYSADGMEGWMAHVSSDLLFIKRFPDIPAAMQAPNEGDSEIFAGKGYVEIEVQGAYQPVAPGSSITWTVRWYVRQLADPSIATVGNAALVTMVRDVITK